MLERLLAIEDHYRELESMLGDPELLADVERWQKMNRELSQLSPIVEKVRDYRRVTKEIEDDEAVLADSDDAELKSLAAEELSGLDSDKIPAYSDHINVSFMREDSAKTRYTREDMLKNAPELSKDGSMIPVPKVL